MKSMARIHVFRRRTWSAFTSIELLLALVILGTLVAMHLPFYSRVRERTHITIDQNNLRQILQGSAIYAAENDERLAHPTWAI